MNVAICTDASSRIGLGHLARCRTPAQALRAQSASVHFICCAHPGHKIDGLCVEGYRVSALPAPPVQDAADGDYAARLGVSQARDATETLAALASETSTDHGPPVTAYTEPAAGQKPDGLIVDHYGLAVHWEEAMRPHVGRLLAIDDLANRRHDCDLPARHWPRSTPSPILVKG